MGRDSTVQSIDGFTIKKAFQKSSRSTSAILNQRYSDVLVSIILQNEQIMFRLFRLASTVLVCIKITEAAEMIDMSFLNLQEK